MTRSSHSMLGALTLLAACIAVPAAASAASSYPCDIVRIVDPYPPGGSTGNLARLVAPKMSEELGRPVLVENMGGASGNIGSAHVARAAADGCMLVIGNDATHAGNYHLFKDLPFHPVDDATPITLAAKNILVLATLPAFPAEDVGELIRHARAQPGKLFYGSSGVGSPHHLSGALLNQLAGVDIGHSPYQNGPPALADVLGGHLPMLYASYSVAAPHLQSGRLKALGVTENIEVPGLPGVRPIGEAVPGFEMTSWVGFFGPPGLPEPIVATLHQAITKSLSGQQAVRALESMGLLVVGNTPREFAQQQRADFAQRGELIRRNNITLD